MQTDYKNLNSFELSVIAFAAVGVVLTCTIVFSGLTSKQQSYFLSAVTMFDLHEQVASTGNDLVAVLDVPGEFYNQFYIAFTQVAVIDSENFQVPVAVLTTAYNSFANYSDQMTFDYRSQNSPGQQLAYLGQVSGASIDLTPPPCANNPSPPPQIIPYSFEPVDLPAMPDNLLSDKAPARLDSESVSGRWQAGWQALKNLKINLWERSGLFQGPITISTLKD